MGARGIAILGSITGVVGTGGAKDVPIKPDYTVWIITSDRQYYWEHLGKLDRDDCQRLAAAKKG